MLKRENDNLFKYEKVTRSIRRKAMDVFLNQLVKEDLSVEEREVVANYARNMLDGNDRIEEDNSKFWYEYGKSAGVAFGVIATVGTSVILSVIKAIVDNKN